MPALLRPRAAWKRFSVGKTLFSENYVARPGGDPFIPETSVPRIKPIPVGKRAVAFASDEIDETIEALKRERDAAFAAGQSPAQIQARNQAQLASEAARRKRAEAPRRKRHKSHRSSEAHGGHPE